MRDEHQYLDPQALLEDAFRLGAKVFASGFHPTFLIAVWRGGAPIGLAVQELLAYKGVQANHIAIRTSAYSGVDERRREIAVYGLSYLVKNLTFEDRLLIVDDVFDTGHTVEAIIRELEAKLRRNMPGDTRIAVPYYKSMRNETGRAPDYYLHETHRWLKYPHSLEGLDADEMRRKRPEIYAILHDLLP